MEVLEIEPDNLDLDNINLPNFKLSNENLSDDEDILSTKPSINFGSGIELLMNDKTKNEKKSSTSIDIEDITRLEDELNDLTNIEVKEEKSSKTKIFGGLFDTKDDGENIKPVSNKFNYDTKENLGASTSKMNENKTWDGYGKFTNIPIDAEKTEEKKPLSKEEELKEKFKYLRKLEDLEKKGVSLSKRYNMDTNLNEMIGEYETIIAEKERSNSIKFQGKMMMACITGLEFLNSKFDPFDIKLDGWGEQINENIDEYDEIFAELHEKYKSKASLAPELKLMFQLGGSALMVHMTNSMFKSAMPGMDDIMRQNPDLMQQFTSAAVNSMGQTNPGLGGFMSSMMPGGNNGQQNAPQQMASPPMSRQQSSSQFMNPSSGGLPPPIATQGPASSPPPIRPGYVPLSNRPDINASRNIPAAEKSHRPEMKGPTDISGLLSGLKVKKTEVNIQHDNDDKGSTISISELKEMQNDNVPHRSKRRKSDRNTISLDI